MVMLFAERLQDGKLSLQKEEDFLLSALTRAQRRLVVVTNNIDLEMVNLIDLMR